jgi:hypothetical protein
MYIYTLCWDNCSLSWMKKKILAVIHILSLNMPLPLCIDTCISPNEVYCQLQLWNFAVISLFALQIDQLCDVTFLYYHFRVFPLNCCKGSSIYVIHIDSYSISSMFNSSFQQTEQFTYTHFTQNCCLGLRWAFGCLTLSCRCRLTNPV